MRPTLCLAAALSIATIYPSAATDRAPSKNNSASTPAQNSTAIAKPPVHGIEKEATEARARNEAKERAWDEKMKRAMRSICSGAKGC